MPKECDSVIDDADVELDGRHFDTKPSVSFSNSNYCGENNNDNFNERDFPSSPEQTTGLGPVSTSDSHFCDRITETFSKDPSYTT